MFSIDTRFDRVLGEPEIGWDLGRPDMSRLLDESFIRWVPSEPNMGQILSEPDMGQSFDETNIGFLTWR